MHQLEPHNCQCLALEASHFGKIIWVVTSKFIKVTFMTIHGLNFDESWNLGDMWATFGPFSEMVGCP
jgi:hypothetical protein